VRIGVGQGPPELHETEHFAGLLGPREVGVGVAQDPAALFQGEKGLHAGGGLALERQVVVLQTDAVAAMGNRMEVQRERPPLGKEQASQGRHPTGQERLLLRALRAVGILGEK